MEPTEHPLPRPASSRAEAAVEPHRVTPFDLVVFAAEVATYVAAAMAGWRVHPAAAVGAVAVMASWWGSLHSPRARVHLPGRVDLLLRLVWFGVGVACVVALVTHD